MGRQTLRHFKTSMDSTYQDNTHESKQNLFLRSLLWQESKFITVTEAHRKAGWGNSVEKGRSESQHPTGTALETLVASKKIIPKGKGTIRRCDFVGGGSLCRWALGSLFLKLPSLWQPVDFLLPSGERGSQRHICLHTAMLPFMIIMDWNSETVSNPP